MRPFPPTGRRRQPPLNSRAHQLIARHRFGVMNGGRACDLGRNRLPPQWTNFPLAAFPLHWVDTTVRSRPLGADHKVPALDIWTRLDRNRTSPANTAGGGHGRLDTVDCTGSADQHSTQKRERLTTPKEELIRHRDSAAMRRVEFSRPHPRCVGQLVDDREKPPRPTEDGHFLHQFLWILNSRIDMKVSRNRLHRREIMSQSQKMPKGTVRG